MQSIEDKLIDRALKEGLFSAPSTLADRLGHGEETIGGARRFAYVDWCPVNRSAQVHIGDDALLPEGITVEIGSTQSD